MTSFFGSRLTSKMRRIVVLTTLLLITNTGVTKGEPFTEIVVFGDSGIDAGNALQVFGVPLTPYYEGRFSDGPVWVDQLAVLLGLSVPSASLLGGTNYAYGGAETGFGSSYLHPLIPNIGEQINDYLATNSPDNSQLFVLGGGANNIKGGETDMSVIVSDMSGHITSLAAAGASRFLISNVWNVGKSPPNVGTPAEVPFTALTTEFAALLSGELAVLRGSLGITIYEVDTFGIVEMVIDNPADFGLTNVTSGAYVGGYNGSGTVVGDSAEYLFWDNDPGHLTSVANGVIAEAAAEAVPEPSGIIHALAATLFFVGIQRR